MANPITQLEQITLTSASKRFLKEISKWAFFLSILGIISIVFLLFIAAISNFIFDKIPEAQAQELPFDLGVFMTITYLVSAIITIFPVYYLFQFSVKMKKALKSKNDETLEKAFEMLKSHFKFIGVFTIIMISLYIMLLVISLFSGSFL